MPYRRKDSPVWWVSLTNANGARTRRSTGTTDRKEAEALEAKWKLEAYRARQWDEEPPHTLGELMVEYLNAHHAQKRSAERDRGIARHLRAHLGSESSLDAITGKTVRGYIQARRSAGIAPGTINRELALLSAMFNYARTELEWSVSNPVPGRKLPAPEGRVRWITRAEAARLLSAARGLPRARWLADFIVIALHTGMRRGEILGLEWRRIDLASGLIHLEGAATKSGKRRSVPINATAKNALLSRARERAERYPAAPWVFTRDGKTPIQSVKKSWAAACQRAGITDFRVHDLRHTSAAWLVSAGVPLPAVRDLLGHASVQTTEIYAHLAPENVRDAVRVLDAPVTIESRNEKRLAR